MSQMNGRFVCEACDFSSTKKGNYMAHLTTKKHIQRESQRKNTPLPAQPNHLSNATTGACSELPEGYSRNATTGACSELREGYSRNAPTGACSELHKNTEARNATTGACSDLAFICENCRQQYKERSGLWKHRKKCVMHKDVVAKDEQRVAVASCSQNANAGGACSDLTTASSTTMMMNMIYDLAKQNQEIKELLQRQNDQLMETAKRPVVIQQQIINNNHTTNNNHAHAHAHAHAHVDVNLFLQEKCGSALNLTDFVDQLNVQLDDVEMVGRMGFVEGISRIILKELNRMDIYTRPIHCTDMKRETIYIRERNEWMRDTKTNENTKRAIARVANKNLNKIPEWRKHHPETDVFESPEYEMNMQIMVQSLGGLGGTSVEKTARNQEKILKRILPEVAVDKKTLVGTERLLIA
jgi:hypothetical protein